MGRASWVPRPKFRHVQSGNFSSKYEFYFLIVNTTSPLWLRLVRHTNNRESSCTHLCSELFFILRFRVDAHVSARKQQTKLAVVLTVWAVEHSVFLTSLPIEHLNSETRLPFLVPRQDHVVWTLRRRNAVRPCLLHTVWPEQHYHPRSNSSVRSRSIRSHSNKIAYTRASNMLMLGEKVAVLGRTTKC